MKLNYFNILESLFIGLIRHFNHEPNLSFARGSKGNENHNWITLVHYNDNSAANLFL
jgi:hypothetical protein